jgi:hypothetical protein
MPRGDDPSDKADYKTYWENVKSVHQVSCRISHVSMRFKRD